MKTIKTKAEETYCSGLVHKGKRKTLSTPSALGDRELTPDALREAAIDACLVPVGTRRRCGQASELRVESLGVFAVLFLKTGGGGGRGGTRGWGDCRGCR